MSLFDTIKNTKAVFFEDYIAFDVSKPYAVQLLDENEKEEGMEVFESMDDALLFIDKFNNK